MSQVKYIISDASKIMRVETHVLRYWEEELGLEIPRNEMGHRYYTEKEMKILQGIKRLKEQGFQLKSIKMVLPKLDEVEALEEEKRKKLCEELNESLTTTELVTSKEEMELKKTSNDNEKMQQFELIMNKLITNALKENNQELTDTVTENVVKEMDYLMRMQEEKEEEHYKKLDEALRERYPMSSEIAATELRKKKRKRFFKRK